MAQDDTPVPTRTAFWVKIALAVSLALNLLVVGFLAGSVARQGGTAPKSAPTLSSFGLPYMIALSKAERQSMRRMLRAGGELPDRQERRVMFDEVLKQLRADPFDVAALEAAVRNQADVSVTVQRRVQEAWLETVSGMSDAQRQRYTDDVEALLRRRGSKR